MHWLMCSQLESQAVMMPLKSLVPSLTNRDIHKYSSWSAFYPNESVFYFRKENKITPECSSIFHYNLITPFSPELTKKLCPFINQGWENVRKSFLLSDRCPLWLQGSYSGYAANTGANLWLYFLYLIQIPNLAVVQLKMILEPLLLPHVTGWAWGH